jgi:hypothetical protein
MMVGQVHIENVAVIETKDDPPIGPYRDAPVVLEVTLQRVKAPAGKIDVLGAEKDS